MDYNKIFQSKIFKFVLIGTGSFLIILLIFGAGLFIGYKKAGFSYRWAENYHKNFAGPRNFLEAHGVFGSIIKIDGSTLVIKGSDNVEKTVLISDKTLIQDRRETLKISDLKVDDQVVIIGSPTEDGQIEAKFIRIMPK